MSEIRREKHDFWEANRQSGGYLLKRRVRSGLASLLRALLFIGLCFLIVQPILTKIGVSFMPERDLYDSTIVVLPRSLTLKNYQDVLGWMNYFPSLWNTLWISLLMAVLQVISSTVVGYGFARFDFPLKKLWFACVILVIIIPPQTISTSLYLRFQFFDVFGIFKALTGGTINLRKSLTPYALMCLTCMGLKDGLYIFMLRQYFRGIPKSLEDAAYVDGSGMFRTFLKVMLPGSTPIITSCFLFAFVWQWTDRFYTRNFLTGYDVLSNKLSTLADSLSHLLSTQSGMAPGQAITVSAGYTQQIVSTGLLLTIAPLLILYCFAQRGFVESISVSGMKE